MCLAQLLGLTCNHQFNRLDQDSEEAHTRVPIMMQQALWQVSPCNLSLQTIHTPFQFGVQMEMLVAELHTVVDSAHHQCPASQINELLRVDELLAQKVCTLPCCDLYAAARSECLA